MKTNHPLRLLAPYIAVLVFWCLLSSAWLAILAYHAQVLFWSRASFLELRWPARSRSMLLVLPAVLAGPLLYVLLPCMTRADLSAWLASHRLTGLSFPLYSFRRFSPGYRVAFDIVFGTHASHVLMHTFLYAVLAWLMCPLLPQGGPPRRLVAAVLLGSAVIAGLQEALQMACERVALGGDEIFDFLVDLNGGLLGAMLFVRAAGSRGGPAGPRGMRATEGNNGNGTSSTRTAI